MLKKQILLLSASSGNSAELILAEYEIGQEVKVDIFAEGDIVDVTGISKGKGFQGSIKRHGQSRGPMAHGSRYHRRPGSMGPVAPNRVFKGKILPGRMGGEQVTVQNLKSLKLMLNVTCYWSKVMYLVLRKALCKY